MSNDSQTLATEPTIHLREANPLDSENLNNFFSSVPLLGDLDLKIHRPVDFFSFFQKLSPRFKTYILEESLEFNQHEILGTASFIYSTQLTNKEKIQIAFGCDLRISSQRKAIIEWSKYFLPQIEDILDQDHVDHIITSINMTEAQAINAFIRPKIKRSNRPIYELVQKFELVTIHGFYPARFSVNQHIYTERFQAQDKPALIDYLQKKLNNLDLVDIRWIEDLENNLKSSSIYSLNSFIIAKNADQQIVGCVHPVKSKQLQNYFPQSYNTKANNFRYFLKVMSFLGLGRKLTKPFSRTNKEETLSFKMLHFLFFEHPDVFGSLINKTYKSSLDNEFMVYAYQPENFKMRPPKGTIHTTIPYGLYEIKKPTEPINSNGKLSSTGIKDKIQKFIHLDNKWF